MITKSEQNFDVGGVILKQPFKIRRLGHFGINSIDMEAALYFYRELLGFRISDTRDPFDGKGTPDSCKAFGDCTGYFMRYGSDHHAFVIYNYRQRIATDKSGRFQKGININQITWQCGTLGEVVRGHKWLSSRGREMLRSGRDMPGSNWHTYLYDPDGHTNELYYGIEQIGWSGHSKPQEMHKREFKQTATLPQIPEYEEVNAALAKDISLLTGRRDVEKTIAKYDVDGILLPRPFKIVKIGPIGLFVKNLEKAVEFYTQDLGFIITTSTKYKNYNIVHLRNNTEHHSLTLADIGLRSEMELPTHSTCLSFGLQLGSYRQLKDAIDYLEAAGVEIREVPNALGNGMHYTAYAIDPDGQAIQLYYYMEQIGWNGKPKPNSEVETKKIADWPETVEAFSDTYMGESFMGPLG